MLANVSYRVRVALTLAAVAGVTALLLALVIAAQTYKNVRDDIVAQGQQVAQAMSQALLDALRHDDVWFAYSVMRSAAGPAGSRQPSFVVVDRAGYIFASNKPQNFSTAREREDTAPELAQIFNSYKGGGEGETTVLYDRPAGQLTIHLPLSADTERVGGLLVSYSQEAYWSRFRSIVGQGALFTLAVALITMLVGFYLGGRLVHRLSRLAGCMARVGREPLENIQCPLPLGSDEIGNLTASFFRMVQDLRDKEELERQMVSAERLAEVGRLAAGVAHEINNPLSGMLVAIDTLKTHGAPDERTRRTLDLVERGLRQIRETVGALLLESRRESRPLIHQDFEDVRTLVESQVRNNHFRLEWRNEVGEQVKLPSTLVRQILLNLMLNAAHAAGDGGAIRCAIAIADDDLVIKVWNGGPPISAEVKERLFEPHVTTREEGGGLGLWVSHQIATQLQGSINVESRPDGTEFEVILPLLKTDDDDERTKPRSIAG